jgi:hypothetical protein
VLRFAGSALEDANERHDITNAKMLRTRRGRQEDGLADLWDRKIVCRPLWIDAKIRNDNECDDAEIPRPLNPHQASDGVPKSSLRDFRASQNDWGCWRYGR